ncbi:MAG TPA: serine hydrolase [Chitinophagaceae bacterium]|nr:serine hydrolase [Chitinophagaceae bacterium]
MHELRQQIIEIVNRQQGTFAVACKDLTSGKVLLINEHELFHAASTMKVPVMIEVFKEAKEHRLSLNDSIIIKKQFASIVDGSPYELDSTDDSDATLYRHIGEKRSVGDLLYQMITISSNLATNLLMEKVSPANIMSTLKTAGANDMQVLRGVEDNKAFDQGLNNTTSAFDLLILLEKIADGKIVDKQSCSEMIRILMDQQFNEIIPANLPPNIKVAHKTGFITGVQHDAGIVFLPHGRKYVLVLLSKNLTDADAAVQSLALVSEIVYRYISSGK